MPKTRQRGTGIRVRSEAKAALADRLLLAAADQVDAFKLLEARFEETPRWRFIRRRTIREAQFIASKRFMQAITAAQDVAKKGRTVEVG